MKGEVYMINFKPQKRVSFLPAGEYTASISSIKYYEEKGYFALDFLLDDQTTFNSAFAIHNAMFNQFASNFTDDNDGYLDETQMIDSVVKFTVQDNKTGDKTKSKVTALEAVYEE